jgi:hypothetical protein
MPELLISARNSNNQQIGEVVATKGAGHIWGNREGLPGYIHLTISDSTPGKDHGRARGWIIFYEHTIQSENPVRYRLRTQVHPQAVSASDEGAVDNFDAIMDWAERIYAATSVSIAPTNMLYDLPKPADLAQFNIDLADNFDHQHNPRHDFLSQSFVDQAIAAGGELTMTDAQADAAFIDKLTL